jgi:hypothetical protein
MKSLIRMTIIGAAALTLGAATELSAQATETATPFGAPARGTGTGPNGATMRCRDGSYPAPGAAATACDSKGGVLVRFPLRATPQTPAPAATAARRAPAKPARDTTPPAGFTPWKNRAAVAASQNAVPAPQGATLRCQDGTWIARDTSSVRCASHGGVQARIAQPPTVRRRGQ